MLAAIADTGKIPDEDAFEAAVAAFTGQFAGSTPVTGPAPDAEASDTTSALVDADTTLPEADISLGAG